MDFFLPMIFSPHVRLLILNVLKKCIFDLGWQAVEYVLSETFLCQNLCREQGEEWDSLTSDLVGSSI